LLDDGSDDEEINTYKGEIAELLDDPMMAKLVDTLQSHG
jgi:hypothetical protein